MALPPLAAARVARPPPRQPAVPARRRTAAGCSRARRHGIRRRPAGARHRPRRRDPRAGLPPRVGDRGARAGRRSLRVLRRRAPGWRPTRRSSSALVGEPHARAPPDPPPRLPAGRGALAALVRRARSGADRGRGPGLAGACGRPAGRRVRATSRSSRCTRRSGCRTAARCCAARRRAGARVAPRRSAAVRLGLEHAAWVAGRSPRRRRPRVAPAAAAPLRRGGRLRARRHRGRRRARRRWRCAVSPIRRPPNGAAATTSCCWSAARRPGRPAVRRRCPTGACPFVLPVPSTDKPRFLRRLRAAGVRALDLWSVAHPSLPAERFPRAAELRADAGRAAGPPGAAPPRPRPDRGRGPGRRRRHERPLATAAGVGGRGARAVRRGARGVRRSTPSAAARRPPDRGQPTAGARDRAVRPGRPGARRLRRPAPAERPGDAARARPRRRPAHRRRDVPARRRAAGHRHDGAVRARRRRLAAAPGPAPAARRRGRPPGPPQRRPGGHGAGRTPGRGRVLAASPSQGLGTACSPRSPAGT